MKKKAEITGIALLAYCFLAMLGMVWWRTFSKAEPPYNLEAFFGFHIMFSFVGIMIAGPIAFSMSE